MMNAHKVAASFAAVLCLAVAGCNDSSSENTVVGNRAGGSPAWLADDRPAEWIEVGAAKKSVAAGETVSLRGRIGGRAQPITTDSPAFVIMDMSIPSCADIEGDTCSQPWDYCCEPTDSLIANSATIIVLDENGNPTEMNLIDAGLKPLDELIVTGTVDARPNQDVLTVRATSIHKVAKTG